MRCTAKSKRSQEQCKRHATPGRSVCRMHGGRSPRGVAHPSWRGRGYSKDLPTELRDRYAAAESDPDLSSSRSELALIDARLGELFEDGVGTHREWARVYQLVDLRRKVANTEHRRESVLQTHMTRAQTEAFMYCVVQVIAREEPDVKRRVLTGISELLHSKGLLAPPAAPALPPGES